MKSKHHFKVQLITENTPHDRTKSLQNNQIVEILVKCLQVISFCNNIVLFFSCISDCEEKLRNVSIRRDLQSQ